MAKVRVFVDHSNFECSWERARASAKDRLNWARLPNVLIERMMHLESLTGSEIDFRGVSVYASVHPCPSGDKGREKSRAHWLQSVLDQMEGYTVKISARQAIEEVCSHGHKTTAYREKGVDTKIACDMLSLAMRDLYDIALVLSDDADLIPSVECVQDVLDKKVIHVGLKTPKPHGGLIRSAAWAHILLDPELVREPPKPPPTSVAKAKTGKSELSEAAPIPPEVAEELPMQEVAEDY